MKKYKRKVARVGKRSLCIVIPSDIVKKLNISNKQELIISTFANRIIINQ